jgi:uncharacterized linocin/CFP29 family protein
MNGYLGRDKVWTPDTWSNIDKAVTAAAGQVRVVQKVFPTTSMPNAQSVPADIFNPNTMTIQEGATTPLVELSITFPLTQSQVDKEATDHTGQKLAALAVKTLALFEDAMFFQGQAAVPPLPIVRFLNGGAAGPGLVSEAANQLNPAVDRKGKNYPATIFQAVVDGIAQLAAAGQPGPYALFLENNVYADSYRPEPNSLVTPADRIKPLVTGGFYPTGALLFPPLPAAGGAPPTPPRRFGLLASLGGEPVSLYVAVDAVTAFTQTDANGVLQFRVYERVQHVTKDATALFRMEFIN